MSLSVHKYIRSMKEIFDALLPNGQSLIEDDLIKFVVDGLEPKYDPMVIQILSRMTSIIEKMNLTGAKFLLQRFEQRMNSFMNYNANLHKGIVNVPNRVSNNNGSTGGRNKFPNDEDQVIMVWGEEPLEIICQEVINLVKAGVGILSNKE